MGVHVRSCCSSDLNGALALKLMHGHVAGGRRRATSLAASFLPLTETQDAFIFLRARLNVSVFSGLTRRFHAKRAEHLYEACVRACVFVCTGQA